MKATLIIYNYYRKQQRGMIFRFIKNGMGLNVERVDLDKLVVELGDWDKEDFRKDLRSLFNHGKGGIESINFDKI